jgi:hypothetical protein
VFVFIGTTCGNHCTSVSYHRGVCADKGLPERESARGGGGGRGVPNALAGIFVYTNIFKDLQQLIMILE